MGARWSSSRAKDSGPSVEYNFVDELSEFSLKLLAAMLCLGSVAFVIFSMYLWATVEGSTIIIAAPFSVGSILAALNAGHFYYDLRQSRRFLALYIFMLRILLVVSFVFSILLYFCANLILSSSDMTPEHQPLASSITRKEGGIFLGFTVLVAMALFISQRIYVRQFQEYTAFVPSTAPLSPIDTQSSNERESYGALDDVYGGRKPRVPEPEAYQSRKHPDNNEWSYGDTNKENPFRA